MAAFNLLPLSVSGPTLPSLSRFTCQVTETPFAVHTQKHPEPLLMSLPPNPNPNPNFPPSLTCALNCSHFQSCSGCAHEYNLHRPAIVDEATDFFKKLVVSDFTFDSCRLWGWRCRAKLAVRGSSTEPLIGLYQEGTHNVFDIPNCKANHPNVNAAVELLKKGIMQVNVEPYDEDHGTGELRYVQIAVTTYDTSLPTSQRWRHLFGESDFWEHVGGIDVSLAPSSFGQANTRAFDSLLRKLQKYVPYGTSVIDLYAGAGVIGLSLAATRKCRAVKCVEVNKESKLSFEKTVERLPSTLNCNISWHQADTSVDPISWLVGSDVVVVDPPRKGLEPSLIRALQAMSTMELKHKFSESPSTKAKHEKRPWVLRAREASTQYKRITAEEERQSLPQILIYVSCGWHSFKEDCMSLLSAKTWHLEKAHGFNLFPGTQSIEILAVFKRGAEATKKAGKKKRCSRGVLEC